jgi:asparagine synthase (glutamine-hydrolysing)
MCALAGILAGKDRVDTTLRELIESQIHRGPDSQEYFVDSVNNVGIGFGRLAIVDLHSGNQPWVDGEVIVSFNGEIFNTDELISKLESCDGRSDFEYTEAAIIARLYKLYGLDFLNSLNGMFAISIYDRDQKKLFLVRDRFGIKPLFYSNSNGRFLYASELQTLRKCINGLTISNQQLRNYMSLGYVPSPNTIFNEVNQLEPGEYLSIDCSTLRMEASQWYRIVPVKNCPVSNVDAVEQLRYHLRRAIYSWSRSDVPVSYQLSGGVDSGLLSAIASEGSCQSIVAYTLGFQGADESQWDETDLAMATARKLNAVHHLKTLSSDEVADDMLQILRSLAQPYSGGIPSWFLYKEIAKNFRVVMTGTGADELFGNYNRAAELNVIGVDPRAKKLTFEQFSNFFRRKLHILRECPIENVLSDAFLKGSIPTVELMFDSFCKFTSGGHDLVDALSMFCMRYQLSDEFLLMTDQFSMAHSVESRTPYLDHRLVEFAFSLPEEFKSTGTRVKFLLKDLASDYLPNSVIEAKKRGFSMPLSRYMRTVLKNDYLSSLQSSPFLADRFYHDIVESFLDGDNSHILTNWAAYMAEKSLVEFH